MSTAEQRLRTGKRPRQNPPGGTRGTDDTRSVPRSTAKARAAHPPEVKAEVLRRLRAGASLASEHERTGIAKGTLSRWAVADGIDLGDKARARTANASATVKARATELKVTTVDRLERILEESLEQHTERLRLERALTLELGRALAGDLETHDGRPFRLQRGDGAPTIMLRDPDSHLAQLVAALELLAIVPTRDTVGTWTRANHDLALLKGEATERGAVLVQFGIPRPDTSVVPVAEADLGR